MTIYNLDDSSAANSTCTYLLDNDTLSSSGTPGSPYAPERTWNLIDSSSASYVPQTCETDAEQRKRSKAR